MNIKQIIKVLHSLDEWQYDQIVALACKVPAIQLETKYALDAYFMLGSYARKNCMIPVETLAKCFPYINMGVVKNSNEVEVMAHVIKKIRGGNQCNTESAI